MVQKLKVAEYSINSFIRGLSNPEDKSILKGVRDLFLDVFQGFGKIDSGCNQEQENLKWQKLVKKAENEVAKKAIEIRDLRQKLQEYQHRCESYEH